MVIKLQIFLIICSLIFGGIIVSMLRKEMLDLKYSFSWLLLGISLVIIAVKPGIVIFLAHIIGIIEPVNAVFLISILLMLVITFSLSIAISRQARRMKKLVQELAFLERKIKKIEENEVENIAL